MSNPPEPTSNKLESPTKKPPPPPPLPPAPTEPTNGKDENDLEKILEGEPDAPSAVKEVVQKTPSTTPRKSGGEPKLAEVSVVIEKMDPAIESEARKEVKKRTWKRRSRRSADLPTFPRTGYVRFMNQRREGLKTENPNANHVDITKMLGDEWTKMTEDQKRPYMEEADKDKERYMLEMKEYRVAHPEEKKRKKVKPKAQSTPKIVEKVAAPAVAEVPVKEDTQEKEKPAPTTTTPKVTTVGLTNGEVPIFTDEFLEHNKQVETQLKTLRKAHTDYEFQNSNLERYIENMKTGIGNLQADNVSLAAKNDVLEKYLEKLKTSLVTAFSSISLPTEKTANAGNIEKYMMELTAMTGPASTVNKAKDVMRKLDLCSMNV